MNELQLLVKSAINRGMIKVLPPPPAPKRSYVKRKKWKHELTPEQRRTKKRNYMRTWRRNHPERYREIVRNAMRRMRAAA